MIEKYIRQMHWNIKYYMNNECEYDSMQIYEYGCTPIYEQIYKYVSNYSQKKLHKKTQEYKINYDTYKKCEKYETTRQQVITQIMINKSKIMDNITPSMLIYILFPIQYYDKQIISQKKRQLYTKINEQIGIKKINGQKNQLYVQNKQVKFDILLKSKTHQIQQEINIELMKQKLIKLIGKN